ncbi:hypothetical protein TNCV_1150991 [Trichonephila clavipes]|nr:hypothetical protein TNCV_1150991 [Trichonephila clavipes]
MLWRPMNVFQEQSSAILMAKAVIDTGAQISVVRADVIEGQSVDSGGTIKIMSAFGEREVPELKIFSLKIDDSRHGVVPIMCSVSKG